MRLDFRRAMAISSSLGDDKLGSRRLLREQRLWNYATWALVVANIALLAERSGANAASDGAEPVLDQPQALAESGGQFESAEAAATVDSQSDHVSASAALIVASNELVAVEYALAPFAVADAPAPVADRVELASGVTAAVTPEEIFVEADGGSQNIQDGPDPGVPPDNGTGGDSVDAPTISILPGDGGEGSVVGAVDDVVGGVVATLGDVATGAVSTATGVVTGLLDGLNGPLDSVLGTIEPVSSVLEALLDQAGGALEPLTGTLVSTVEPIFSTLSDVTSLSILNIANSDGGIVQAASDTLGVLRDANSGIQSLAGGLLGGGFQGGGAAIGDLLPGAAGALLGAFDQGDAQHGQSTLVASGGNMTFASVQNLPGPVSDLLFNGTKYTDYHIALHSDAETGAPTQGQSVASTVAATVHGAIDAHDAADSAATSNDTGHVAQLPSILEELSLRGVGDGLI